MSDLPIAGPAKPAVQSLTIQGVIVSVVAGLAPPILTKLGIIDLSQQQLAIQALGVLIGGAMSWIGRSKASQPVRGLFRTG